MAYLSPAVAADFANQVYSFVNSGSVSSAVDRIKSRYAAILDFQDFKDISAKTGGPGIFKSRTAFGFLALGKGAYKGHAFIIIRGSHYTADWLTNINIGVSRSVSGQSVHNGFNTAFKSMQPQLTGFVNKLAQHGVHSIHCVGHSLGGGLANLCADYIATATSAKPYLYTFGAPRVGLQPFANSLSTALSPAKIFRVYHRTDIVPCIPFWPFTHAPSLMASSYDYFQPSPGSFPSGEWHSIKKYVSTVGSHKWESLRGKKGEINDSTRVENWINSKSPIALSITNLGWLDKAINYVLGKVLKAAGSVLTIAAGASFTLMDRLAYMLEKGIVIAGKVSGMVLALIRRIMSMLGMNRTLQASDATTGFIRGIFLRLSQRVNDYARNAIDQVLVRGEAV